MSIRAMPEPSLFRAAVMRRAPLALLALAAIASCAKKDATAPDPTPASVVVVQGANQSVQGGKELPTPIVLRVLDASDKPVEGVPVSFVIAAGGGAVNPGTLLSDKNGEAKTKWTLGASEAGQKLEATVPGVGALTVNATALLPADIIIVQGNNQSARAGQQLPNALVVRVVGASNTPMVGVQVGFQITAGGGIITPQSATTNAAGEVTARWTMGPATGTNALAVYVGSLPAQLVVATAAP
jgi:adhesin/invasin